MILKKYLFDISKLYMSNSEQYYYWDYSFLNNQGLTLKECFVNFGTGTQNLNKQIRMEVIFLDDTQDFGNSWCLRCYDRSTKQNIPVRLYEQKPHNKVYGRHLVPSSGGWN